MAPASWQWRSKVAANGVAVLLAACASPSAPEIRTTAGVAQGTTYTLQWVGDASVAEIAAAAERELERLDELLSNYRADSALERFNTTRTVEPIELPSELVELLALAKRVHGASDGCFDPTVRPLVRVWGFDGDTPAVPAEAELTTVRASIGLDKLELLDATHVRKSVPELEIDMSSIGQGHTAARLAALLAQQGSTAYLAEIGGEIVARGVKPDGTAWRVGLEAPGETGSALALSLPVATPTAVITSGSYRHYFEVGGRRLGHVIDPRSGWPVEHGLLSVTVVGEDAATAAAWGTALLCLGPLAAAATADRERVAALFWLNPAGDGEPELERSRVFVSEWDNALEELPRR